MIRIRAALVIILCLGLVQSDAQSLSIVDSPTSKTAVTLDVNSTAANNKGFLIPRMTEAQKNAIAGVAGLQIYQTDGAKGFYRHDGTNWLPWIKPISGIVAMDVGGSTITRGEGFSVLHEETGRDIVTFHSEYENVPHITLGSQAIAGIPPSIPNGICDMSFGLCSTSNFDFFRLRVGSTIGSIDPPDFAIGSVACYPVPGNRLTYKWGQDYSAIYPGSSTNFGGSIASIPVGTTIYFYFKTEGSGSFTNGDYVGIWIDSNQSGTFEASERLYSEPAAPAPLLIRNSSSDPGIAVTVPLAACNGLTAMRVVVGETANNNIGCGTTGIPNGEVRDIELLISGGSNCLGSYQERQTICNVSGLNPQQFRVECSDIYGGKVDTQYHFRIIENN